MTESAPNFLPPYFDRSASAPRFKMSSRVRVLQGRPPGHTRTPWYVRGATGAVERVLGHFADPQELAYRRDGLPKQPLYRVRFALADIWGARAGFAPQDSIDVEIYENWLEPFFDYGADPAEATRKVERDLAARRL